jgi:hypothetical protein
MPDIRPSDFGLTDSSIEEIRARDRRQAEMFVRFLVGGCVLVWLVLTALIYARSARKEPFLGLLVAPVLGLLGAVIAGLPVAIASTIASWLAFPRHPQAKALERYEAASAGIRICDVCRLARGDETPKEGVAYCSKCGAWICPDCRRRYDLRAIAALKRRARAREGGNDAA